MKAIDLFCGCGGISAGLREAGFDVLAGVDVEPQYLATFSHNFPNALSLKTDISKLDPKEFMDQLGLKRGELDLLSGGPPCQGFSKNVPRKYRFLEDPNNQLIRSFLDYVDVIRPRCVIMENVAEMKNGFEKSYTDEIFDRLSSSGYEIAHGVLNAADFGVPQRRRRAFFLASRDGTAPPLPCPTHFSKNGDEGLFPVKRHVTVKEAIGDLPSVAHGNGEIDTYYAKDPFSEFQRLMRNGKKTVRNHIARHLQPTQYARLAALKPGQGLKDLPPDLRVKGGYSGAYGRLTWDMVPPTITRWVFHPGSGRWGHPVDIRVLTIREVARIQGFKDEFEFVGTYTQQAGQLGNAVPPLLSQQVAKALLGQDFKSARSRKAISASSDTRSSADGKRKVAM